MTKTKRSDAELIGFLHEQVRFLENSAAAFDAGFEGEGKRLATTIRTLVHDTSRSHSILAQLGVKEQITFVDTADPINPRNMLSTMGLLIGRIGGGGSYVAPLGNLSPPRVKPPVAFERWWTDPVTKIMGEKSMLLSRRDYVLTVANKEGGAHVDPELNEQYGALVNDNALGWIFFQGEGEPIQEKPFDRNPALASVRQITFELLQTLDDQIDLVGAQHRSNLLKRGRPVVIPAGIGRNAPCPCGSGKKLKKCHGS